MSPIFISTYIVKGIKGVHVEMCNFLILLYADDIVLMTNNEADMQLYSKGIIIEMQKTKRRVSNEELFKFIRITKPSRVCRIFHKVIQPIVKFGVLYQEYT